MLKTFLVGPKGEIFVNPAKRYVKPYWLNGTVPTTVVPAGAVSDPITFTVDNQGHFEWFYIVGHSDAPYTLTIFDTGRRRFLMNREIHSDTIVSPTNIAGALLTGGRPHILMESYFINVEQAQRALQIQFRNLDTVNPNTIRLAFVGRRYYYREATPEIKEEFRQRFMAKERTNIYFVTTDRPISLAAGATDRFTITSTDEADFEFLKMMAVSTGAFTWKLIDKSSGREFSPSVLRDVQGWGTADFPFILPESFLIERNYQFLLEVTNLTDEQNDIFVTLHGRRLYYHY